MVDTHNSALTGGSGYWSQAATWDKGAAPAAGDSVIITSGDTVYYDIALASQVSLASLTVTGTLRFVTGTVPANGAVQSTNPATRTGLGLLMADAASITGAGAIYAGNSTTDYIARPAAAATYLPNVTITLGTTGIVSVATQRYYGWIPSSPATHPSFTTMTDNNAATDTTMTLSDATFDVQQGEKIIVGVGVTQGVMAEANKGLYTCNAAPATSVLTISTAGGLVTDRIIGDYLAIYSRPILITKPVYNNTKNSVSSGVMQGARINNIVWTSGNSWTYTGITVEGNNTLSAPANTSYADVFTDCVGTYGTTYGILSLGSRRQTFINCIAFNSNLGMISTGAGHVLSGCVTQNNGSGLASASSGMRLYNCKGVANSVGGLLSYGADCVLVNCTGAANDYDLYRMVSAKAYNSTLTFYTGAGHYGAPWATVQSRNHAGGSGARVLGCRGGAALIDSTYLYNGANTMHFTVDAATTSVPLAWDTPFWLPANKTLTVTVPMYKAAADTNITADVWVVDPSNDPLWFDQNWTLTPSAGTTQGTTTATYVLARTAMPNTTDAWQLVTVMVPAQTTAKQLIARVIVKGTTVGKNCYAYLDGMERSILKKKLVYL